MHNRAFQWINLHEDHSTNQLDAVDPFFGSIAASSPLGALDDREASDYELALWQRLRVQSLDHYRRHVELLRARMQHALCVVESFRQSPRPCAADLERALSELRAITAAFCALYGSPFAWQNIHSGDSELIARAEFLLQASSAR